MGTKLSLHNTRLVISTVAFAGLSLALVGVSARSTKKSLLSQEAPVIQFRNYTKAFEVVTKETVGDTYVVSLKNVSAKAISAYTWSLGTSNRPTNTRETDFAVSGQVISPGAIHREEIPLAAFTHSAETTPSHQAILNFIAVLFDDNSGDGRPEAVEVLKDWRTGERIQMKRVKRLLKEAALAEDSQLPGKLDELRSRISELPVTPEIDQSDAVGQGLLSAKRHASVLLDHLRSEHGHVENMSAGNNGENARRVLSSMIEQTDIWLSRY